VTIEQKMGYRMHAINHLIDAIHHSEVYRDVLHVVSGLNA